MVTGALSGGKGSQQVHRARMAPLSCGEDGDVAITLPYTLALFYSRVP